ncbi:MAG: hypothetical protein M1819_004018 [Sarea resinae]|nr:MAG: hypothetical protein M1819_004018 [Sarea resinae]
MPDSEPNPLLSSHQADSGLQVLLHPLVLLTISDYITRHTLRRQPGPIVGALLGQQNGREISLEHAFECHTKENDDGEVLLLPDWFAERIQQFRNVHKAPALDLVGWFSIAPTSGPQPHHLPIHQQISEVYNESAVFLAFHPTIVAEGSATGGQLPLTIYESVYEGDTAAADDRSGMQVEGGEGAPVAGQPKLRFRELPYSVETGKAEMIGVDFVARGGGNAMAVEGTEGADSKESRPSSKGKGKGRDKGKPEGQANGASDDAVVLSPEDEELIASLTAKANATKMLHSRILLLKAYLSSLPPSYLTTPSTSASPTQAAPSSVQTDHTILRSMHALLNRLPLLVPSDTARFATEARAEKNDVQLVALLGVVGKSVRDMREMGRKFAIIDNARSSSRKHHLSNTAVAAAAAAVGGGGNASLFGSSADGGGLGSGGAYASPGDQQFGGEGGWMDA